MSQRNPQSDVTVSFPITTEKLLVMPVALVYKLPGFLYSSYSESLPNSPVLIAMPMFEQILTHATQVQVANATTTAERAKMQFLLV